jgi:DNA adenine methylase
LKPFLKWAGGKRWFVYNHADLLPIKYNRYIEPFLGSGAVFFHLCPEKAILSDSNKELIDTYMALKENVTLVQRYLEEHHKKHSPEYYYKIRNSRPKSLAERAARFIYLNRTCWNGLYRVNLHNIFNVPIGTKSSVLFQDDCFDKISDALRGVELYPHDFETIIDKAGEDDFLFVDPPYTVRHNNNAFIKYNEKLFTWSDQERLFCALKRAKNRGVHVVGTNACNKSVIELYEETFSLLSVSRHSSISSKMETRKKYEELVIMTGAYTGP